MEKLIWPGVVLLVIVLFFVIFRRAISELIGRINKTTRETKKIKETKVVVDSEPTRPGDESSDNSMTMTIPNRTPEEIKQLNDKEILENMEFKDIESPQKYFKFSKFIERSLVPNEENEKRRIRFRIGIQEGISAIINIKIYSYLVVTKLIRNHNNVGWGSNWPEIKINKEFIPYLENNDYWSISHNIDSDIYDSPLNQTYKEDNLIKLSIAIYAIGNLTNGQIVFGQKRYSWDKENCRYGSFRLKKVNENQLSNDAFDEIVPVSPEKGIWPNLK